MMTLAPTIDDPAYFDRLAAIEARHWWAFGMWRLASYWLDHALAGRSELRALDVGCGTGLTALRLANRPEVASVVGIDPSPEALRHASRRHDLPLVRGSVLALPFESGRFDVLTCFDVLQHLPPGRDCQAANELRRVLAPRGVAVIRSNARGFSGDLTAYRLRDLSALLATAGLTVVRASYANCLPALAQELRGRLASSGPPAHPGGGGLQIRVPHPTWNRWMGRISETEAWLAGRHRAMLPFGHSTLICAQRTG